MGQKDLAQNDYLNDKVRFADMCNGILFGGDDMIRPEELPYDAAQTICDIAGIDIAFVKKVNEKGREVACMCKAWDDHKETGRREGRREGILITLVELVQKGLLAVNDAAAQAGMSMEEFQQKMQKM